MPTLSQFDRPLRITTPLGEDAIVISTLRGEEAISRLFHFEVELLAEQETEVQFDLILGREVSIELHLENNETRYFSGMVKRFTQGSYDRVSPEAALLQYRAELVPRLWLATKRVGCRTFQLLSVPAILERVLAEFDVCYELSGSYPVRDYCVQFRESDFDFVSRLMEEEGIAYYFNHSVKGHQMVITDGTNPMVSGKSVIEFGETTKSMQQDMRIMAWEKTQELRAAEYILRDHCFQLPGNPLEANQGTMDRICSGAVTHKLVADGNNHLAIYEYPGGYAKHFDGISPSGSPRPENLAGNLHERERTVRIRMEEEEAAGLVIAGASDCGHFSAGHQFTLARHFDGDGNYLLTRVEHSIEQAGYVGGQDKTFHYENRFTCIPDGLKFRPQRVTARPSIAGVETATVTGNQGDEIFCDKFGRVKVQFHWDREGKMNGDSSCWLRVAQVWAGSGWGAFFWPRVGDEVVVAFEDGDPDRPLIIGSVYNAENMPWFGLPANKNLAGFKSASLRGSPSKNFNGIVFNDKPGNEHVAIHSERNLSLNSESDKMIHSGRHKGERVGVANILTVGKLIPSGGSGGGNFDEGNPMPSPAPTGVLGLSSTAVYGDNLQMACGVNHQLAVGNNVQICINPFGLAAGTPGAVVPALMESLMGGGMGGSMQFTVGSSAQFTFGQSFEISIGPPKIEIHSAYGEHALVDVLCVIASAVGIAFAVLYAVVNDTKTSAPPGYGDDAAQSSEQRGDKNRATCVLVYQLLMEALLAGILAAEAATDQLEWLADDLLKKIWNSDASIGQKFGAVTKTDDAAKGPTWWDQGGEIAVGSVGVLAAIAAEIVADSAEG